MSTVDRFEDRFSAARLRLTRRFFPDGIPKLWCPPLTHYAADGSIDRARMQAHLRHMHPWVRGFLVPGSTGDGWELSDSEARELLEITLPEVAALGGHVLVGVLKTDTQSALAAMQETLAWLKRRSGNTDNGECLRSASVCGFTICAPKGAALGQDDIRIELEKVLQTGLPTALYQLPQVTENEMSPELVRELGLKYDNFYLLKDTSGRDSVASSGFRGVFLVRGAEGDYAQHLGANHGAYDGFLLSTANCFARGLHTMIEHIERGALQEARIFSDRLSSLMEEAFALAGAMPCGNPFTNANKAIDHYFAHGPRAAQVDAPRLHSGHCLPKQMIEAIGTALVRLDLMPARGYLE